MCVHRCRASQKSLGLALLLLLEWTPVDPLCCCGRDCGISSILPSWMAALLGSVFDPLLLPCSSRRPLGIVPSSARQPLGRFVPHLLVGVLPAPSQALGRLTDRCVVVVFPSSSR